MTIISAVLILACFAVGGYFKFFSDKIDAPVEQVVEFVLLSEENIDVDFSADKKKKLSDKAPKDEAGKKD